MNLRALCALGVFLCLISPCRAAIPEEFVGGFDQIKVGGSVDANAVFRTAGHLAVTQFQSGRTLIDGTGSVVGALLRDVTLQYQYDPADEVVIRYNVGHIRGMKNQEKGKPLTFHAQSVVWVTSDARKAVVEESRSEPDEFLRGALQPRFYEPSVNIAAGRLRGDPTAAWVDADLGNQQSLFYELDSITQREQLLFGNPQMRTQEIKYVEGYPLLDIIDDRPLGRSRQAADPQPYEVTAVDAKIVEQPKELGQVNAEVEYRFLRDWPGVLSLSLNDKDLDVITANRVRLVEGTLKSVTDMDGHSLSASRRGDALLIQLPRSYRAGETVRLKFDYTIPLTRFSGNLYWHLGEGAWFPRPPLRYAYASFHLEIQALKPFLPFASGTEVRRWQDETWNSVEYRDDHRRLFPQISAGTYFPYRYTDEKKREISVVSYAMARKSGQERLAKLFAGLVQTYERIYPPYPFDHLTVVEANDWGFGQAPAGYITITKEAFNPLAEEVSMAYSKYANEIFAHEIGHAWWAHTFRVVSDEDQWLEESFAEYSAALVLDVARKKGDMNRKAATWRADMREAREPLPIVAANRLAGEDSWRVRQALLYAKGPWVLHCLRSELGDETFYTLLRSFIRSFDGKPARTEDLLGLLNFITKKDYRPWFDKYVYGPETPQLVSK